MILSTYGVRETSYTRWFKRPLDVLGALVVGALSLPVIAVAALAVRLEGGGPVFFRARRLGRGGVPFDVLKLRTMVVDAPTRGPGISRENDDRITAVGQLLRRWKIDELTQWVNVLRGDMSLVGPRPQSLDVHYQSDLAQAVSLVRPGLTDWASIYLNDEGMHLPGDGDVVAFYRERVLPAKQALVRAYLQRRSFAIDTVIVLQTAWVLVASRVLGLHLRLPRPWLAGDVQVPLSQSEPVGRGWTETPARAAAAVGGGGGGWKSGSRAAASVRADTTEV